MVLGLLHDVRDGSVHQDCDASLAETIDADYFTFEVPSLVQSINIILIIINKLILID